MTYDRQLSDSWENMLDDITSKIAGMASWGTENDASATGHYAINTPQSHYVIFESKDWGDGSNSQGNVINIELAHSYTDPSTYSSNSYSTQVREDDLSHSSTDSYEYWLQYSDTYGFALFWRRQVDQYDYALFCGIMDTLGSPGTELWDYSAAANFPGTQSYLGHADQINASDQNAIDEQSYMGSTDGIKLPNGGRDTLIDGKFEGMLNPDSNFDNYIWSSNLGIKPVDVENSETNVRPWWIQIMDPIWLRDQSGSDLTSGDVVQDSGGADQWEILEYHDVRVALRMI